MAVDPETLLGQLKIANEALTKTAANTTPGTPVAKAVPVQRDVSFSVGPTEAGGTQGNLYSYVVPRRQRVHVEYFSLQIVRWVASTTVGDSSIFIQMTGNQALNYNTRGCPVLEMFNNTVGATVNLSTSCDFWLYGANRPETGFSETGDNGNTSTNPLSAINVAWDDNNSNDGTIQFICSMRLKEYSE
jgi:hypothetical protein